MKSKALGGLLFVVAAIVFAFASAPVMANNLTISISNGGAPVTCADNAACDSAALPGVVNFSTTFGQVSVTGTGSGSPMLPGANMDLSYNFVASSAAPGATYTIAVSETNISGTNISWGGLINGNQDGTGVTTSFNSWADAGDALFAHTTPLCSAGPVSGAIVNLACSSSPAFSGTNFSLTEQVTLVVGAGSHSASGDARLATPEPASLMLFGSGLLGIAGLARRYFRVKA